MRTELLKHDRPFVCLALCLLIAGAARAADLEDVLRRLDRLEEQNRALMVEVKALREELAARQPVAASGVEEKAQIEENRVTELAQTKVEASQRFPIRVTGMALFNTFLNTKGDGEPGVAVPYAPRSAGATLRQTILGLEYRGPATAWNGKVRGSLFADFFGGSGRVFDQTVRLRTAVLGIDWTSRSVEAGIEKPLIAPRDPNSLAQVAVPPLSGAGNLWAWMPQVRVEQRIRLGPASDLRAQIAAVETSEAPPAVTSEAGAPGSWQPYQPQVEARRPGIEARLEFSHGEARRFEIAPGFHRSVTHAAGTSIPSTIFSADWYMHPFDRVEFSGAFFTGRNVAPLGAGAYQQGFTAYAPREARAVGSRGGWAQLTLRATGRLSFHLFSGQQDDTNADLEQGRIGKNLAYGANFFYRLAPNVLLSIEASQLRTDYIQASRQLNNHYDLGLAYLF